MEEQVVYCLGFLFSPGFGNIALIEKKNPAWMEGKLNGAGGVVKPNEAPLEVMKFKCKEELGVEVEDWKQFCLLRGTHFLVHCYYAESQNIIHVLPDKKEPAELYSTGQVLQGMRRTVDNVPWLISMAIAVGTNHGRCYSFSVEEVARRDIQ